MRRFRSVLIIGLVAAAVLQSPSHTEAALPQGHGSYTDVEIDGDTVTIVVPIAVIYALSGSDGPPDAESVAVVEAGFASGAAYWNAGFSRFAKCFDLRLRVDLIFAAEDDQSAEFDRSHIVRPYSQARSGTFPDGRGLPAVVFPGLPNTVAGDLDITYPFDEFSIGYLPGWLMEDSWAMAHELGHFFGLGDDYHDGEVIPGREGTLMGGTEGGDYIDKSLVDDVASLIEAAGYELPQCITGTWTYRYDSDFATADQTARTKLEIEIAFSLVPATDGTVSGTGAARFSFESTATNLRDYCVATYPRIESEWVVTMSGHIRDGVLSFQASPPFETIQAPWSGCYGQSGTEPITSPVFYGGDGIRFTDGVYEHHEEFDLGASDSGKGYFELKLKQTPPD